jgi:hypothetical protein
MTAHERLEPNDVVRFTEDFKQWGTIVARKGDFALMHDRDQDVPGITLLDGRVFDVSRPLVEKVQGEWVPLSSSTPIVDGKTLVRFKRQAVLGETFPAGSIHPVFGHVDSLINLRYRHMTGVATFSYSYFDTFVPSTRESRAMTFATAAQYVVKLNDLTGNQGLYRLRQRSWDKKGRYAAIDETGLNSANVLNKLYTAAECEAEVKHLEDAQPAIDVIGESQLGIYTFKVGETYLLAPDNTRRWTDAEIRACGGIVRQGGHKYRLCREEVVRTVKPIVAAS